MSDQSIAETQQRQSDQIAELEVRVAYLDETVDALNTQLATLTHDFDVARQAMQLMNQRIEQLMQAQGLGKSPSDDTPPPHY